MLDKMQILSGLKNRTLNPNTMLNQMMRNNPHFKSVMEYVNANGGDPKTAFYKMAGEMGVNPDEFLAQLNSSK